MKYELVLRRQAKADIRRAARWYESQRRGLGKEFVLEVDAAIARIEANPEQYQIVHRNLRRSIARRFPYGIFYRIEGSSVIVFAIVHLHQDETTWKRRAESAPDKDPE